jgi:small subunit ribosomal protein S5
MSEIQNKPAAPAGNSAPRTASTGARPFMGTPRPAGSRPAFRPSGRPGATSGNPMQKRRIVRGEKSSDGKPNENNRGGRGERPRSEYDQKMIDIRRVTRVVSGGRRMSFAVALVIGDKKGTVGLGTGKGADTAIAIAKALKQAKKGLIKLNLTDKMSLPHEVSAKFNASRVTIRPNNAKGMVAGSSIRDILTLAGIHNVTGKLNSGSKNKLSNARAAMKALAIVGKPAPVYTTASSDAFTS